MSSVARQFRVLYREFLFRMIDLELLSSHALGDSNKLLGRFAALLIFVSIGLAIPAMGIGDRRTPPALRLFHAWSAEHFLIATTMLVVGLFAVLSWDSTFPDRRDVLVLGPLPVRARTLVCAKVAAGATALALTVGLLHALSGLAWPFALGTLGTIEVSMPALEYLSARPPVDAAGIGALLERDLAPALTNNMGVSIGVLKEGRRHLSAYGTAQPDSIYQIASISKTFTGLLLAQMAAEGKLSLDQPVRELLPAGTVRKPEGREITLRDLAIHRSGLPPVPNNLTRIGVPNPGAGYEPAGLYAYIGKRGVARPANPPFIYSNVGFALLGQALAERAGLTYSDLVAQRIAAPLGMRDTAVVLSPEQQRRVIPAYSLFHDLWPPWEIGALAPAGGISSTASDMLTYLHAQLQAGSSAIRLAHELQADLIGGRRIALAWVYDPGTATYWHNGAISAYTSHALFNPKHGYAVVVLVNQSMSLVTFADLVAQHIRQRLMGEPAISLASVTVPASGGFFGVIRMLAVYWLAMLLAAAFVYCCVLLLQGLAAQLLPRRIFLRVSSILQMLAFCVLVSGYFLQPLLATGGNLIEANGSGILAWSPSYWFLGLFQQLNGSPALAVLARRAWIALGIALAGSAIVYIVSSVRTLRGIAEEPDIVSGLRRHVRLPNARNPVQNAMVRFSIRTLLRSRLHRLILAFYLGIGFAFVILLIRTPAVHRQLDDAPVTDLWGQVNAPLLAASIAMMGFAIIGTRVIFSIPVDLRANWIFRVTGVRTAAECLAASRRSLLVLSLIPAWLISAATCIWLWPWLPALGHLAILAGLGLVLAELCLYRFQKIPFTCSYLPGKSQVHLSVLGGLGMLWFLGFSIRYEKQLLEDVGRTMALVFFLVAITAGVRWKSHREAKSEEGEVRFEDALDPAVQELGLNRDGSWELGPPHNPKSYTQ